MLRSTPVARSSADAAPTECVWLGRAWLAVPRAKVRAPVTPAREPSSCGRNQRRAPPRAGAARPSARGPDKGPAGPGRWRAVCTCWVWRRPSQDRVAGVSNPSMGALQHAVATRTRSPGARRLGRQAAPLANQQPPANRRGYSELGRPGARRGRGQAGRTAPGPARVARVWRAPGAEPQNKGFSNHGAEGRLLGRPGAPAAAISRSLAGVCPARRGRARPPLRGSARRCARGGAAARGRV